MCRFFKFSFLLFIATALGVAVGCHATAPRGQAVHPQFTSPDQKPVSQQLIIKFKPSTVGCDQAGIASFSGNVGMQLTFIRPMSGAACVVTHSATDAKALIQQREKLNRHASIEWAEPDAVMKTQ